VPASTRVPLLLAIMRGGENEMVRTMAAVLLRRVFTSAFEEFWPALPDPQKQELRQQMLAAIQVRDGHPHSFTHSAVNTERKL
jgi:hypothetical protein